jgi:hypothetical protein
LELDVDDKIFVIDNNGLMFSKDDVGINGSMTRVKRMYTPQMPVKDKITIEGCDEGVDKVYNFLSENNFI